MTVDADTLPLTHQLILDVLASRLRTGSNSWTFPSSANKSLVALELHGLVRWKAGSKYKTSLAWLTDAGRAEMLDPDYITPRQQLARDMVEVLDLGHPKEWLREWAVRQC